MVKLPLMFIKFWKWLIDTVQFIYKIICLVAADVYKPL